MTKFFFVSDSHNSSSTRKKWLGILLRCALGFALAVVAAKVQAQTTEKYEEISYDDLVNRLSKKKSQYANPTTDTLDEISLHAGVGLMTNFSNIRVDGTNYSRQLNGFQVSFGIDLLNPSFLAEGAIRNYGSTSRGSESITLRETDMRVLYRGRLSEKGGFRAGTGLATRNLKFEDRSSGLEASESTPAWIFFAGLEANINKYLSMGLEAGYRSSMVSKSADKGGVDLMMRLDTHF